MTADNSADAYDELLILARDARQRRKRTSLWTCGLIAGAVGIVGAYVAAVNGQVKDLIADRNRVIQERNALNTALRTLVAERGGQAGDADSAIHFAPTLNIGVPSALSKTVGAETDDSDGQLQPERNRQTVYLSNIVWLVDGSRRFPMTRDDILWIPEAQSWIRLVDNTVGQESVSLWGPEHGAEPTGNEPVLNLNTDSVMVAVTGRGATNCAEVDSLGVSRRPGFNDTGEYLDIDVRFFTADEGECVTTER